jgi:hypothetical protein
MNDGVGKLIDEFIENNRRILGYYEANKIGVEVMRDMLNENAYNFKKVLQQI